MTNTTVDDESNVHILDCRTHQKLHSVRELVTMFKERELRVPELQRNFVWNTRKQQEFLGSMLQGLPTLNLMFAIDETDHVRYVLDGLQRLTTLQLFMTDRVALGEPVFPGKKFSELPEEFRNKIRGMTLDITEVQTSRENWRHIFCVINRGGLKLTDMEIRRALYPHQLLTELESIANHHQYWLGLFGKNKQAKGLDALLRAVAMHYSYQEYRKPMNHFLDGWCLQIDAHNIDIAELVQNLDLILEALWNTFKKQAFTALGQKRQINLSVIDSLIHGGLLTLESTKDPAKVDLRLRDLKKALLIDEAVALAFTEDTSGREAVMTRMTKVESILRSRRT